VAFMTDNQYRLLKHLYSEVQVRLQRANNKINHYLSLARGEYKMCVPLFFMR